MRSVDHETRRRPGDASGETGTRAEKQNGGFQPSSAMSSSWLPLIQNLEKQGHGEIDHLFGLGDDDRLALEAPEPMTLAAMMALNGIGRRFALQQFVLGYD
jgi:hypothetical protein